MKPCYIVISATGERVDLNPTTNPNEWTAGERAGVIYDPNDPNECAFFEVDDPNDPNDQPNEFGKGLIGKAISYYDSFNGSHEEFVVARVVDLDEYFMQVRSKSGRSFEIPKHLVDDLLADGVVTDFYELDGCSLKTTYKLS